MPLKGKKLEVFSAIFNFYVYGGLVKVLEDSFAPPTKNELYTTQLRERRQGDRITAAARDEPRQHETLKFCLSDSASLFKKKAVHERSDKFGHAAKNETDMTLLFK